MKMKRMEIQTLHGMNFMLTMLLTLILCLHAHLREKLMSSKSMLVR